MVRSGEGIEEGIQTKRGDKGRREGKKKGSQQHNYLRPSVLGGRLPWLLHLWTCYSKDKHVTCRMSV